MRVDNELGREKQIGERETKKIEGEKERGK